MKTDLGYHEILFLPLLSNLGENENHEYNFCMCQNEILSLLMKRRIKNKSYRDIINWFTGTTFAQHSLIFFKNHES